MVGFGYVGLPLATSFAEAGVSVIGFEVDAKGRVADRGSLVYFDVSDDEVRDAFAHGTMTATVDFSKLTECDAISVCVPTPLRKTRDPDLRYIVSATEQIAQYLRKGQLVILESTTYPGTTIEVVAPMLEKSGLKVGEDVHLVFSPERIDPGNETFTVKNTPKIVGGLTPACNAAAEALYTKIVNRVVTDSNPTAAEMVKLLENTFRAVNIGLVNEIAIIADKLKLDVWEVIEAAASKPWIYAVIPVRSRWPLYPNRPTLPKLEAS